MTLKINVGDKQLELWDSNLPIIDGEVEVDDSEVWVVTAKSGNVFTQVEFSGMNYAEGGMYNSGVAHVDDDRYFKSPTVMELTETDILTITNSLRYGWSGDMDMELLLEEGEVEPPTDEDYSMSLLNLYNPTYEQLMSFNSYRWSANIDLSSLVYSVYYIPIKLPDGLVSEDSIPMFIGNHDTKVISKYLTSDRVLVDLGSVKVEPKYNNVFDYKNVECVLYIPYSEPVVLDVKSVVGRELDLLYSIDLLNVVTNVYVIDSDTRSVLFTNEISMLRKLPYVGSKHDTYDKTFGQYIWNENMTPYLEVRRPKPLLDTNCIGGISNRVCGEIGGFEGYVKVDDVMLESIATSNEKERIINLLKDGVYIR